MVPNHCRQCFFSYSAPDYLWTRKKQPVYKSGQSLLLVNCGWEGDFNCSLMFEFFLIFFRPFLFVHCGLASTLKQMATFSKCCPPTEYKHQGTVPLKWLDVWRASEDRQVQFCLYCHIITHSRTKSDLNSSRGALIPNL